MTEYYPKSKNVKYFFAYYDWMGLHWPMTWMTEDGITVGGHPFPPIDEVEITEEEFNHSTLVELVRKYPRKTVDEPTPKSDTNPV